ncbi:hypothetical protein SAMN04488004_11676 [Loktanella salsilacus]|uniref:Uncharacterized protein n=1 Tax=Loktanella salsilacus TaxID=195913 RepID=A0A1I4H8U5_9RHOB|nr:hypothetical protein [Loktanella salsilacus]SFL38664.1 hypothetical protein SAMN04488004_11676 [Loktanella salsilacus]
MKKHDFIGYLKAQYAASSAQLKVSSFMLVVATAPSAISIFVNDENLIYTLAILNGVLVCIWLMSLTSYQAKRRAAHEARRAALLTDSFDADLSSDEVAYIRETFTVKESIAIPLIDEYYYDSKSKPGYKRLLDNIEESAYYTSRTQKASRQLLTTFLIIYACSWILMLFIAIPDQESVFLASGAKLFMAITIFMFSGGLVRAWIDYGSCAKNTAEIVTRCNAARVNEVKQIDVLMILLDYSGYIDSSPEALPNTYYKMREKMEENWKIISGGRQ